MDIMISQELIDENSNVNVSSRKSCQKLLEDPVVICPLDKSHRMPLSEFQCHLERCLIGDLMEKPCPRNPLHILDEASYDDHVQHCQGVPMKNASEDQASQSKRN